MKKKLTQLSCIVLALCLLLCGNWPAIATDTEAPAEDTAYPVITHTPVQYGRYGEALTVSAQVTDDTKVESVQLFWRSADAEEWTQADMTAGEDGTYSIELSPDTMNTDMLQYYLLASDGTKVSMQGSEDRPLQIIVNRGIFITAVSPAQADIGSLADGVTAVVTGENFSEDMIVLLGGAEVACTFESATEIRLPLTALQMCKKDLLILRGDDHATMLDAVTFYDAHSSVKLGSANPESVFVGQTVSLPITASSSQMITDVELGIRLDPAVFEVVEFVQSDANTAASASCTVSKDGLVSIRLSSAEELNKSEPIGHLTLKVKYNETMDATAITFETAKFQAVDVAIPTECPVAIRKDISIELLNVPDGLQTLAGVLPNCEDWSIKVTYPGLEIFDTVPVTPDMLAPVDQDTISVTYMGVSKTFACQHLSKDLFDKLEIVKAPDKTVYVYGEPFDPAGMQAVLTRKDGTEPLAVNNYTVTGYDAEFVGNQNPTVRCGDFETTLEVTVNPANISSDVFTVKDGYLVGIPAGSTSMTLLEGLNDSRYVRIFKGETEIDLEDSLCTGMTVCLMNGETVLDSVTLIIIGDVNGDGLSDISDMLAVKRHILSITQLENAQALAADYNSDSNIDITDFLRIKAYILGIVL